MRARRADSLLLLLNLNLPVTLTLLLTLPGRCASVCEEAHAAGRGGQGLSGKLLVCKQDDGLRVP